MEVVVCQAGQLAFDDAAACRRLTFPDGTMRDTLNSLRYDARVYGHDHGVVLRAMDKQIVLHGWAVCAEFAGRWTTALYVRRASRRQGIATALLRHAATRLGTLQVEAHDSISLRFFEHAGLQIRSLAVDVHPGVLVDA